MKYAVGKRTERGYLLVDEKGVERYVAINQENRISSQYNYRRPLPLRITVKSNIRENISPSLVIRFIVTFLIWIFAFSIPIVPDGLRLANDNIIPLPFILLMFTILIVGLLVIKINNKRIAAFSKVKYNLIEQQMRKFEDVKFTTELLILALFLLGIGVEVIFGTATAAWFFSVLLLITALQSIIIFCDSCYQYYLISKYCPYLKTLEDRRYDREEDRVPQTKKALRKKGK